MKKQFEKPEEYLRDMLSEIVKIEKFTKGIESGADLANDEKSLYACVRSFEIMGEAAKHISPDFRKKHPKIPWQYMSGMRDKLIHDYGGVDAAVVWKTIQGDLPALKAMLQKIVLKK
ncbi:MAG: DUF86 domain-containing protein [Candidatus Micrarchaeota archaeon]|nr:DUF86 domain-containing protein [Candidatus Micrarchaeota archaeon]